MYKIIFNNKDYVIIPCASTFTERLIGLMGKENFKGLLFKQKYSNKISSTIHTFFMKENIDIIYVDKNNMITQTDTLKTWKIHIPKNNNTKYIIELPENSINRKNIKINTKIKVVKAYEG